MVRATQPEFSNGRRDLLRTALAGLILSLSPLRSEAADMTEKRVIEQDLPPLNLDGWEFEASELTFPPGMVWPTHRHSGFVIGYVLEGEFRFRIAGQPETILKAGQMYYEPPGVRHLVGATASSRQPARVLAIFFGEKGKPMTVKL